MSGFFRFLAFLLAIGLLAAIGIGIYNAGVSAGLGSDAGLPPYVGQPWDMGWFGGIFAFIFERDYFEAWHRELHGEAPETPDAPPNGAPGKPATDQA
jgi:hypothetical protein